MKSKMVTNGIKTDLLFDGYCPESALRGKRVEMRLNEDDFWESLETGLQITTFSPFAAILRWRGKGKFKLRETLASNHCKGFFFAETSLEAGRESYPEEKAILDNTFDLKEYIGCIFKSEEAYFNDQFDPEDFRLMAQAQYLETISTEEWVDLVELYKEVRKEGISSDSFTMLHRKLYDLGVIFTFPWQRWHQGATALQNPKADFSSTSLLELSMYLTFIFRCDRISEGTINRSFNHGILDKLFARLEQLT